jgi:hypothetical protein
MWFEGKKMKSTSVLPVHTRKIWHLLVYLLVYLTYIIFLVVFAIHDNLVCFSSFVDCTYKEF